MYYNKYTSKVTRAANISVLAMSLVCLYGLLTI
jgi:hypothetical protein